MSKKEKRSVVVLSGSVGDIINDFDIDNVVYVKRHHYCETLSGSLEDKLKEMTVNIYTAKQNYPSLKYLIILNAVGSLHKKYNIGDIAIISDHIDQIGNPLLYWRGKQNIKIPNSKNIYSKNLISRAIDTKTDMVKHTGVLLSVKGPTFNTPAERLFYSQVCDFVSMSGSTDAIMGAALGLNVLLLGLITDNEIPSYILDVRKIIKQNKHRFKYYVKDIITALI